MDMDSLNTQYPTLSPFFSRIPPKLLPLSRLVRFRAGSNVVLRDASVEYAYFVLTGEMIVYNETVDGKFSTWLTMRSPTVISDLELLSEQARYAANVSAVTDCDALCFPAGAFAAQLRCDIDFLWLVASIVTQKNFDLSHNRGYTAFRSSLEKTALYLLQYCALYPPAQGKVTVVRRTRPFIASEIVISQRTLDRCLMKLREQGYLSIIKGKVHISAAQYRRLLEHREQG